MIIKPDASLVAMRDGARVQIGNLIEWHRRRIKEIDEGHTYWKNGANITAAMRERHETEINACRTIQHAIQHMNAGDVQRAAKLCNEIQERLPSLSH